MAAVLETTTSSLPLSPEQRAAWAPYGEQAAAGAPQLLLQADLDGELDATRLEAALQSVLQAHVALRSAVLQVPGFRGLRQQALDAAAALRWQKIDLRGHADQAAAMADWIAAFTQEPLDVAQGALLRVGIARLGETRHKLVLAVSVFAADKGSLRSLLDQTATAYLTQQTVDADEVFQYAQFVEWRQDLDSSDEADAGRAYWRASIERADALQAPRLHMRLDGASPAARTPSRIRLVQPLDASLAARVQELAAQIGCGADRLLQAAWWLLVARLTGHKPFVAGWQNDCRHDYEVMQGAVGVFEKILPVVVDVAPEERFTDWVARVNATLDGHTEAQEYWAVDAPPISAHLELGFTFDNLPVQPRGALAWRVDAAPGPQPCFELALQVEQAGQAFTLSVHADASRYSPQALERLQWQLVALLEEAVAQPAAPVGSLVLVGARERESLLLAARGATLDVGSFTLAQQVAGWARTTPDAPALEAGDVRLSYREFDAQINRMARGLQARGATAETLVALNLPRSVELLVAMLASWRLGAGYLPLDPEWPAARRRAVLEDAAPSLVLHAAGPAPDGDAPWRQAALDEMALEAVADGGAPAHQPAMQDVAYVLYTSGSTGTPKGVVIEQGHLLNYVAAVSSAMDLGRCRRWGLTSSVVADLGNTALFSAFHHGACLVVAGPGDVKDASAFARFMREGRIDALKMVPSHLEALLEDEAPALPATLVLGGEAAPRSLIERIARFAPASTIYNHYGPTETTVGVMVHRVSADETASAVLPLSRVLANNRVHVLDEALRLVPSGALGTVYVGGAQVCRGYLNREVAGAFVADPFEPGQRLYRTGDVAYVLPEGGLRLAGRADDQVKIRGFRVEPAEVEAVLLSQPGVRQAVVLALPDGGGGAELRAFVVADETLASEAARGALSERLGTLLPAHMVPARCAFVAEFARLPNGKIDRQSLLSAARVDDPKPAAMAPRDALEAVLAECMAALVQRDAVGVEEDFFELGGHSLLVIKLVARIRKLLRLEIAPGLVFDHPSAATLAAALRALEDQDLERMEQLAKTHAQERLADSAVG
ncbi:amino acid adenylation domain-containing protein [Variovorax sp. ZS18.2.2]|uniref:non-ribosomal peptide synthetase n=1 Tax=Variovorax sp. ZS18.2.2 TaxID=2971255 RepID=UPI002151C8FA|nr:non-ribosomal peptide synthetase [Variovorax sp. ZS18.2.2]MCR6476689.1 amino acid adenylation domain-containing protein [Variovorax sp. ZS18.2.2]